MFFNVKEDKLKISDTEIDYITFGIGKKNLIMIQGLNTGGIKGAGFGLAFMYRMFAKEYKVYLFDRRPDLWEGITVRDFAKDIALAMDELNMKNADIFVYLLFFLYLCRPNGQYNTIHHRIPGLRQS